MSVRQETEQQSISTSTEPTLRRTSQLIGKPVKNAQGEKLGTIHDLVLTPDLDRVSYVALARGGILGIGESLYAVPWSSMKLGATGAYVMPISRDELTQWRGFRPSAWPSEPSQSWVRGAARPAQEPLTKQEKRDVQERRVTRIEDKRVDTPEGLSAGHIQNLVVAMDTGDVQYTIVSFGGVLGIGSRLAAVPQGAINLEPGQRVARLNVGREVLRDNAFTAGRFPDLGNASYARNIDRAYGITPGETVLGYVPARQTPQGATTPKATQPTQPKAERTPTTGDISTLKIDPQAKYDPAAAKTVQGVVTTVGKFVSTGPNPDMLLQIRTDTGDLINVDAGPLNYVSKQDFYVVAGDHVSVTGAPVQSYGKTVFLASQVSKDGQILTLRDDNGQPLWGAGADTGQQTPATSSSLGQHTEGTSQQGSENATDEMPTP
ncbi:MAG: PRC-barrel domain-containing protein [Solirubrobacterales bacterium]